MTVKSRLLAVCGFLIALSLLLGGFGLWGTWKSNEGLKTVYEDRTVALEQVSRIDRLLVQNQLALQAIFLTPQTKNTQLERLDKDLAEIEQAWKDYIATYLTPTETQLAKQFQEDRMILLEKFIRPQIVALKAGDEERARQLFEQSNTAYKNVYNGIQKLRQLQVEVAKDEYELAQQRYELLKLWLPVMIILGASIGFISVFTLIRSIYRELGGEPAYASQIVHQIASGDLRVEFELCRNEDHSLLHAMRDMQQQLAKIIGHLIQATGTMATATSEIASGNLDLSSRTEEQAGSLEETASSLEELSNTVARNAKIALEAAGLASAASNVAQRGGQMVSQVVTTMQSINESARKIAEINGVIDGIAFQTNILALNAAVEAARAGEQGRGFAVVASEVRNLAQRSASAAKEIKALIDNSVQQVELGARLVDQAGGTMNEIVESIGKVTAIQEQMSNANQGQAEELEQINHAVSQVDTVTQQNAALVEEAAAAAASLEEQAQRMLESISFFKTEDGQSMNVKLAAKRATQMPQLTAS